MMIGKFQLNNCGDFIRFRNIIIGKIKNNSAAINKYIKYDNAVKWIGITSIKNQINIYKLSRNSVTYEICYVADMALRRRFNILGSGWVDCTYKGDVLGVLGKKYEGKFTDRKFHKTNSIYWNRDMKTGYVWEEGILGEKRCIESPEGVDIKNVWELGRLNFLIPLALYAFKCKEKRRGIVDEYKNIITDFDVNNKVPFGVNWVLAMEPAIRICNILFSYDILQQLDKDAFDDKFSKQIQRMTAEHCMFIWNNLEKNIVTRKSGNHYFTNLSGLVIALSYINIKSKKQKRIYKYAIKELFNETYSQFYKEGGHFEASTGYFRQVAEMLVITTAILSRNSVRIPKEIVEIICSNYELAKALKCGKDMYYSYGDCDDGQFIHTEIKGKYVNNAYADKHYINLTGYTNVYGNLEKYFVEDFCSLEELLEYTNALVATKEENEYEGTIGYQLITSIVKKKVLYSDKKCKYDFFMSEKSDVFPYRKTKKIIIPSTPQKLLKVYLNKSMGLYIVKANEWSLFFLFGNNENAGHGHNDSMHYEYVINNRRYYRDIGTFTYTGFPEKRNYFRSSEVHNVPCYQREQREFGDCFSYCENDFREIIKYTGNEISVYYHNKYYSHIRSIKIESDFIIVNDKGSAEFTTNEKSYDVFSEGYGIIENV